MNFENTSKFDDELSTKQTNPIYLKSESIENPKSSSSLAKLLDEPVEPTDKFDSLFLKIERPYKTYNSNASNVRRKDQNSLSSTVIFGLRADEILKKKRKTTRKRQPVAQSAAISEVVTNESIDLEDNMLQKRGAADDQSEKSLNVSFEKPAEFPLMNVTSSPVYSPDNNDLDELKNLLKSLTEILVKAYQNNSNCLKLLHEIQNLLNKSVI